VQTQVVVAVAICAWSKVYSRSKCDELAQAHIIGSLSLCKETRLYADVERTVSLVLALKFNEFQCQRKFDGTLEAAIVVAAIIVMVDMIMVVVHIYL
jgi:hypothetical protein